MGGSKSAMSLYEQKTINEMKMELPNAGLHYLKTTLSELIEPFAKEVMAIITNGFGGDGSEKKGRTISLLIFLVYHYNSFYAKVEVSPFLYNWLQVIDDVIAELLPGGVERLTRGFPLSCVWARPHRIVWAQPPKDAWWPGMVLAGHGVPKALAAANFSRIPDEIARQLLKIKNEGISHDEIRRAAKKLTAEAVYARDSLMAAPNIIGRALTTGQSLEDIEEWPERIMSVRVPDVVAAANETLVLRNSVTSLLTPKKREAQ